MLLLVSTTDKVQVITGSAGTIDVHASWMDNISGSVLPGRTNTNISTAATTDVVASPAAGTQRNVKTLHIRNRGAASNTITVQHTDGTIVSQLHSTTLGPGTTLQYIDEIGFTAPPAPTIGSTGDAKLTFKTVADFGWVMMNDGSIGNAASGATTRANADTSDLFVLLYANITALVLQDSTGTAISRGAGAAADYAANRRLVLPATLGRALAGAGSGAGLTSRALGATAGEETHLLTTAEMPSHGHGVNDPGHEHFFPGNVSLPIFWNFITDDYPAISNYNSFMLNPAGAQLTDRTAAALTGISVQAAGANGAHNTMQPTTFLNVMIKL